MRRDPMAESLAALQMVGQIQEIQNSEQQRELARQQAELAIQEGNNRLAMFPYQQQLAQQEAEAMRFQLQQAQQNPNQWLQRLMIPALSQTVGMDPMSGEPRANLLLDYLNQQNLFTPSAPVAPSLPSWMQTFNSVQ